LLAIALSAEDSIATRLDIGCDIHPANAMANSVAATGLNFKQEKDIQHSLSKKAA